MRDTYISGIGMTQFGRHLDRSMKNLGSEATLAALSDAGVEIADIDAIWFSNCMAGLITGQEMIRGETVAFPMGFGSIPMHNVENACASGANALHLAWLSVASGLHDTVLALGVEKAHHVDQTRTFSAYAAGTDVEDTFEVGEGAGLDRTPFVDRQARLASNLIEERGLDAHAFATIAARSLQNAAKNKYAHRRFGADAESVLAARMVVPPLTNLMSSPVSDGAAAVIVTARSGPRSVRILASRMATRPPLDQPTGPSATSTAASAAYESSGVDPNDIGVAEVHDASVAYEFMAWRDTGLCPPGQEQAWVSSGHTEIDGPLPVNPSGGLVGRGHALGATGLAQVHELTMQLRGEAGERQVANPRIALAQIGGGVIDWQTSVGSVHLLSKD